ncbi:Daunorubicin resistance ATP-binding protein drrA, putative [Perkinsus marinus ATCC 50983]|uniref:Daunorubicin resistance ATP-binding protein drrA, putative n=1 Tax=Perkinsus marinus (strain ATCC 50983 / TXsc) TaxID=423536 RepID=C5LNF6_PERM5|nr:Daunorubicin resistance ATP-binding protein drrA, putative [Perkinsus marinus ATCC 50983]EER01707.1 Daunorubicin resistance ATP-binding protein drrA, putative [Perkinsus marinus ATCC 50983]|eukprot:XP_002768989.1 Daunorubicin resistance ATP-binding protein drrA, putative [Perkinsus marinus ATCC 50983]
MNSLALYDYCFCKTLAIGPSGNENAMEFAKYISREFSEWDKYPARVKADSYAGILGYDDKNTTWTFPECKVLNEMESRPIVTSSLGDPDGVVRARDYGSYTKTRVTQSTQNDRICAYIDLEDLEKPIIRSNGTVNTKYARYDTLWWGENDRIQRGDPKDDGPEYYADMGFALIQAVIDDFKEPDNSSIYLGQFPMPYSSYTTVAAGEAFQGLSSMFGVLFYMFPCFAVARKLIAERSGRLREGMRVMGLKDYPYIMSWYLWYFAFYFVISLIVFLFSLWMLPITGSLWLFLLTFLDQLSSMAFTFAVSTLFSSPNSGAVFTCAIYYILAFTLALFGREDSLWGISLLPQCNFTMVCNNIGYQFGIGITNISANVVNHGFTLTMGVVMLIVGFVVWSLVYLYLDQVYPHENVATRKWYFPVQMSYWREILGHEEISKARGSTTEEGEEPDDMSGIERAWDQQQLELLREGQTVDIHNLKVGYGHVSINAVNGLYLEMFRDELFVLLGHNGAGKSTTINVLSGMLTPTSGDVRIFNHRVPEDMPLIRRSMGVCLQHNVLWGDLTVKEHLDLFARIRGLSTEGSEKLAEEVGLGMKYNAKAKTLSGGMQRKLSVGVAFVGNPKVVILDEPSSGMDPSARRSMWDFLRTKREGRIMCVTTHYMDEADILADRVGIIGNGKLLAYGSTSFLKRHYGSGYNVTIAKTVESVPDEPILKCVKGHLSDEYPVTVVSSIGLELGLRIPFEAVDEFGPMFKTLDAEKGSLGISSYGVSVTNLEEVFLKVRELALI